MKNLNLEKRVSVAELAKLAKFVDDHNNDGNLAYKCALVDLIMEAADFPNDDDTEVCAAIWPQVGDSTRF